MNFFAICIIACVSFIQNSRLLAQITTFKSKVEKEPLSNKNKPKEDQYAKLLKKVLSSNQEVKKLLEAKTKEPLIWEGDKKILSGKVFSGTLLNAVVSSNLQTPLIIKVDEGQGIKSNSKFICQGATLQEKVHATCHKLIANDKEIAINAQLLNYDGSAGLIGYVDNDKPYLIAGAVVSDFSQGVLSAATSRIATPLGEVRDGSLKNQMIGGLIESGKTTTDLISEEMKQTQTVVSIPSGVRVLIYFMETVHEKI